MRLVAISMVRNEEDVLEAFVRYHVGVVDELVVLDHASVDRTPEILALLAGEGLPLTVRYEPSPVQRQWQHLTTLLHEAVLRRGADWVLPLDADEFLVPRDRARIERALGEPESPRGVRVAMRTYVPPPSAGPPGGNPLARITRRLRTEVVPYTKLAVPAGAVRTFPAVSLTQGSHALHDGSGVPLALGEAPGLALAHLPVRSPAQVTRKVLAGWLAHRARPDAGASEAFQWGRLFRLLVEGHDLTEADLPGIAVGYTSRTAPTDPEPDLVHDPLPAPFALRYTEPPTASPLAILARTAEALVAEHGRARSRSGARRAASPR